MGLPQYASDAEYHVYTRFTRVRTTVFSWMMLVLQIVWQDCLW